MQSKAFFQLYIEHIEFLVKCAGWSVIKVNAKSTFVQEPFKKYLIIINQISRPKTDIKKDFYKLLNNSHFVKSS